MYLFKPVTKVIVKKILEQCLTLILNQTQSWCLYCNDQWATNNFQKYAFRYNWTIEWIIECHIITACVCIFITSDHGDCLQHKVSGHFQSNIFFAWVLSIHIIWLNMVMGSCSDWKVPSSIQDSIVNILKCPWTRQLILMPLTLVDEFVNG